MKRILLSILLYLLGAQPAFVHADITSNLELHWKLDDGSGTSAADSSGNGRTGTLVNTPSFTTGQVNGGLDLESGSTQYVVREAAPVTAIPITLCAWVNPESFGATRAVAVVYNAGSGESRFAIGINSSGNPAAYLTEDTGVTTNVVTWGSAISTGVWSHVCGTFASGANNLKIYVNAGTAVTSTISATPTNLDAVAAGADDQISPFDGIIDEVRVYSRALSSGDITELMAYDGSAPAAASRRQVIIVQ